LFLSHINTIVFERFFKSFNAIPDKQQSGLGLKFNNSLCVRDAAYDLIMLVSFSSAHEKLNDKGLDILSLLNYWYAVPWQAVTSIKLRLASLPITWQTI
jgi:hypothetical protein